MAIQVNLHYYLCIPTTGLFTVHHGKGFNVSLGHARATPDSSSWSECGDIKSELFSSNENALSHL